MRRFFIGNDHAGVEAKKAAADFLKNMGFEVIDMGCGEGERADYPDYAARVCGEVSADSGSLGILICGTGIGMSIAANKFSKIRAALAHDAYTAEMSRRHNNANVLCFGARVVGLGVMESILREWVGSNFDGGRHAERVAKISKTEESKCSF